MSILDSKISLDNFGKPDPKYLSAYSPSEDVKKMRSRIIKDFTLGDVTQKKPRREFNDMSVLERMNIDQMSFNSYQPNDGDALEGDEINSWKSKAMRPIVRNKCISIAAHATARLIFPKVFAFNNQNDEEVDSAIVMEDLMEWKGEKSNYTQTQLFAVISALVNPASIIYTDYCEVYREVKREKGSDGKWKKEKMLDETLSGFQDTIVPVDELYIENIFEHDIQKQGWLIWRRVQSYSTLEAKYGHIKEFKEYVKPGMQLIYNDANQSFYEVYDMNMRGELGEEITYWNKTLDVKIVMVNGVMVTPFDNPNPRNDKLYPFVKFGYELIDEGKFFYYKSLAFKMAQDAKIINTLYPMIIDGTYLDIFKPMVTSGGEAIGSDVIVPGAVTTLADPNSDLRAINMGINMTTGLNTLQKVEESINASSQDPIENGQSTGAASTAYEISRIEQNATTVLGLFLKMIAQSVKDYGRLSKGDILQYLTIPEVSEIEGNTDLVYKTFLVHGKEASGKTKTRKIKFDGSLPEDNITEEEKLNMSYDIMEEQGDKQSLFKVNPELFRALNYETLITPDVLRTRSEDLERAYGVEEFDKAISAAQVGVAVDLDASYKDFILMNYPKSKRDPDKYMKTIVAPQGGDTMATIMGGNGLQQQQQDDAKRKAQLGMAAPTSASGSMSGKLPV